MLKELICSQEGIGNQEDTGLEDIGNQVDQQGNQLLGHSQLVECNQEDIGK